MFKLFKKEKTKVETQEVKPQAEFHNVQTNAGQKRTAKICHQLYNKLEEIKKAIDAVYYACPYGTNWHAAEARRGEPYMYTFYMEDGSKRFFIFVNERTFDGVALIDEFIPGLRVKTLGNPVIKVVKEPTPTQHPKKPLMQSKAQEWWLDHKKDIMYILNSGVDTLDLTVSKYRIPDPGIFEYAAEYISKATNGEYRLDSIDEDCNGFVVKNPNYKSSKEEDQEISFEQPDPTSERKPKPNTKKSARDKFNDRQSKKTVK